MTMKVLPSRLFPGCEFDDSEGIGFYDITPTGFDHVVSLYISDETVGDDAAIARAGAFFDEIVRWDQECRQLFSTTENEAVTSYFDFHRDEVPDVFGVPDAESLSLADMVGCLALEGMASHGDAEHQQFVVDFTLGCDEILCVFYTSDWQVDHIAWES